MASRDYEYLISGSWWTPTRPGVALVLLALSVNPFGDWLRAALGPRVL